MDRRCILSNKLNDYLSKVKNSVEIGLPVSPSHFIDNFVTRATKIIYTDNNRRYQLYGSTISNTFGDNQITFETINGKTIKLNPKWVISMEYVKLAVTVTDITEHRFYKIDKPDYKVISINIYEVDVNADIKFTEKYIMNSIDAYEIASYEYNE